MSLNNPLPAQDITNLCKKVEASGFSFVTGQQVKAWLESAYPRALSDWQVFEASWNDMPLDQYMADGGRYRRRRYATLSAVGDVIRLEPHQPHYQSLDYNALNGGVAREYEPIPADVMQGNTMQSVLQFCLQLFSRMQPVNPWHIECHQFRIEAGNGAQGKPTPEGVHRDGVDFVLVMMVKRVNISSGTTTMHDMEHQQTLDSFTLTAPLDCAIVNDRRCMHGVTPVEQLDPSQPAYRDVLVITFTSQDKRKAS
ncbi:MAG TPA: 2OG-Fe dioxygenase family protein [Methylophilaceae bacterium]|nr:2OG-Fe dioxygenase family protein [Methylophilaceae bacterium]